MSSLIFISVFLFWVRRLVINFINRKFSWISFIWRIVFEDRHGWCSTFIISFIVLFFWIFLKQKPGIGTILNTFIIAVVIDLTSYLFDPPSSVINRYFLTIISVLLVGFGSGIYLIANLGPGPRDGLMTGLTRVTGYPISYVRASLEITVVLLGCYLRYFWSRDFNFCFWNRPHSSFRTI